MLLSEPIVRYGVFLPETGSKHQFPQEKKSKSQLCDHETRQMAINASQVPSAQNVIT